MTDLSGTKGNILIVDDQPVHLKVLSVMLTRQGYHVRPAISGKVALRAIDKAPPDLILLDIMMPDMDGYDICQTLKADDKTRDIPVIFISALNEIHDKVRAFEVGGVDYITKPFQVEEVSARINTHITLQSMRGRLERKNAELKQEIEGHEKTQHWLDQLRRQTKLILDSAGEGIFGLNAQGTHTFVNTSAANMLGYEVEDLIGRSSHQLWHHSRADGTPLPEDNCPIMMTIRDGIARRSDDEMFWRKDGTGFWVEYVCTPIRENGEIVGAVVVFSDVTDRKQMEAALKQERASLAQRVAEQTVELRAANAELSHALRVKGEFLANMSHELRTPLNAILGMAEILRDEAYGPLNEPQLNSVSLINESGQHLLELINDILDISKIEAGKLALIRNSVLVDNVCQASLRFVQQAAHKKQIEILTKVETGVTSIMADERRLKQILVNLLSNAVKFTPSQGKIGLEATTNPSNEIIRFTVWDTGIGIPKTEMERLFKPFVQVDSSLTRQHEGTGLGLSLVYRLTDMHGGSVSVQSTPEQGSTFTVALPVHLSEVDRPDQNRKALTSSNNHSQAAIASPDENAAFPMSANNPDGPLVLLAENNETVRFSMQQHLRQAGCRVIRARNGTEAIGRAKTNKPDLIFMDIQMPFLNGLEAIRQIRADQSLPQMPIVAITALATPGSRDRCLQAGADQYLIKPVAREQLAQTIHQFLQLDPQRASH